MFRALLLSVRCDLSDVKLAEALDDPRLALGDQLRPEAPIAVPRHLDLEGAVLALHRLAAGTVAAARLNGRRFDPCP